MQISPVIQITKKILTCFIAVNVMVLQTNCSSDAAKKSRLPKQCDGKRKRPLNLEILAQLEKVKTEQPNTEDVTILSSSPKNDIVEVKKEEIKDIKLPEVVTIPKTPFPSNEIVNVEKVELKPIENTPDNSKNQGVLDKTFNELRNIGNNIKNVFNPEKEVEKVKTETNKELEKKEIVKPSTEDKELDLVISQAIQEGISPDLAVAKYKANKNQEQMMNPMTQQQGAKTITKAEVKIDKEGRKILDFSKTAASENDVDRTKKNKDKGFLSIFGF